MPAKRFFIVAATLPLFLGCSSATPDHAGSGGATGGAGGLAAAGAGNTGATVGGASGAPGVGAAGTPGVLVGTSGNASPEDELVVPQALNVMPLSGGNGDLDMLAFTLHQDANGTEAYASLRNDGDLPACTAGLSIQLFDKNQQTLTASIGALLSQHLYRFTDGSGTVAACAGPGDVMMGAITDLPADLVLADVGFVVYSCMYFALDLTPIDGFSVSPLQSATLGDGSTVFTGTFTNGVDMPIANPSVTVFPVNRVGRPLGATTALGTDAVAPGGTWSFETPPIQTSGADAVAFPTGSVTD